MWYNIWETNTSLATTHFACVSHVYLFKKYCTKMLLITMGPDLFKHVPSRVTYLFIFLCTCQVLLLLHVIRNPSHSQTDYPVRKALSQVKPLTKTFNPQEAGPLNGGLRLLWSMNGKSNEGQDPSVAAIDQNSPAVRNTTMNQSRDRRPFTIHHRAPQDETLDHEKHGLYFRDYTFHYIINQQYVCHMPHPGVSSEKDDWSYGEDDSLPPFMLVLVHSHPSHKAQRDAIRDTWGLVRKDYDSKFPVRIVFILGLPGSEYGLTNSLKGPHKESMMYQDIVLGNFTDTYHNLTLKSLFGLQWAEEFCPGVQYIMKTDDDVYFELPNIIKLLSEYKDKPIPMLGSLNVHSQVQRHGLWQVTTAQYPHDTYPSYCSGCGYVLSQDILASLLTAAKKLAMLPIEDVYITGLLANVTGIQCHNSQLFPQWYMGPSPKHICLLLSGRLFGIHNMPYEKMYYIHKKVSSSHLCQS